MNLVPQPPMMDFKTTKLMSSKEVAELTGKNLYHVNRDIRNMLSKLGEPELDHQQYQEVKDARGYTTAFLLNHDLSVLLITGYDVKARLAVIRRWKELESSQQQFAIPQTLSQALLLASQQAQVIEEQQAVIALQQPSVEFVDRYVDSDGLVGIRDAGKILGIPQNTFVKLMEDNKVLFRSAGQLVPFAKWEKKNYFSVKTNSFNEQVTKRTFFTPVGIVWVTNLLRNAGVSIP